MADEETREETKKQGGSKKKLLMIGAPVLVVALGAGFFLRGGGEEAEETTTTTPAIVEGDVIEVDTMTVNLIGEEGRYARIGFAVVLLEGTDSAAVAKKLPLLRDAALTIMTEFTAAELQSAEGMERLRQELSDRSVALFPDGEVLRAVLTELIIQ